MSLSLWMKYLTLCVVFILQTMRIDKQNASWFLTISYSFAPCCGTKGIAFTKQALTHGAPWNHCCPALSQNVYIFDFHWRYYKIFIEDSALSFQDSPILISATYTPRFESSHSKLFGALKAVESVRHWSQFKNNTQHSQMQTHIL